MIFGFLGDIAKGVGSIVGSIVAIPVAIVAETLGITVEMVKEAKEAGCETYEEIRDFFDLRD